MENDLTKSWIEFQLEKSDGLFWAWEELEQLVQKKPEKAWMLVQDICDASNDEKVLGALSAGPLEELIVQHGKEFIDRLEIKVRQCPKFAKLIHGVWVDSDAIGTRVKALKEKYANNV